MSYTKNIFRFCSKLVRSETEEYKCKNGAIEISQKINYALDKKKETEIQKSTTIEGVRKRERGRKIDCAPYRRIVLGQFLCLCDSIPDSLSIYTKIM